MLRLFRVLKIPKKLDDLASNVQSETLSTAISIGRSLGLILVINHFIACGLREQRSMVLSAPFVLARSVYATRTIDKGATLPARHIMLLICCSMPCTIDSLVRQIGAERVCM